ncbi:hypothetical protein ACFL6M_03035 [Candidatus Eisenbacteria bacterium]|uniref:DUF1450 domain-containing protein n=1 Tax=Eiseniibacteriota bacterium TaxID=2212470 RepID=A0ABV6YJP4_UNCEI
MHQARHPPVVSDKVSVTVFLNGWCAGACLQCVTAREAAEGLEDIIDYQEIDTSEVLRQDILKLAREKRKE